MEVTHYFSTHGCSFGSCIGAAGRGAKVAILTGVDAYNTKTILTSSQIPEVNVVGRDVRNVTRPSGLTSTALYHPDWPFSTSEATESINMLTLHARLSCHVYSS